MKQRNREYLSLDTLDDRVSDLYNKYQDPDHGRVMNRIKQNQAALERRRVKLLIEVQQVETALNDHKVVTTRFKSEWHRESDRKRAKQAKADKKAKADKLLMKQANNPDTALAAQTIIMVRMMVDNGLISQATANVALEKGWSLSRIMKAAKTS
ncbi:MAG: hypothetical protein CL484_12180 [Acidobacteria bacterium]|nr:hypothetical protein [Acidobacteriota bacterium]